MIHVHAVQQKNQETKSATGVQHSKIIIMIKFLHD